MTSDDSYVFRRRFRDVRQATKAPADNKATARANRPPRCDPGTAAGADAATTWIAPRISK